MKSYVSYFDTQRKYKIITAYINNKAGGGGGGGVTKSQYQKEHFTLKYVL